MKKIYFPLMLSLIVLLGAGCSNSGQAQEVTNAPDPGMGPAEVGTAFYDWYLSSFGDPGEGTFMSPLVERNYQESEYLTPGFIRHIDEILDSFEGKSGYDPFLCAQDVPQYITAGDPYFHGSLASIVFHSSFPNHYLTVDLQENHNSWLISDITCGMTPEGTVKAFYTWYLAYIGDRFSGEMRNPLVENAYRDCGFLSEAFIAELDELTEGALPADPILMAQDIPGEFSVDPGTAEGTAIVHLQFGSDSVNSLLVTLIEEQGSWKINQIVLQE
jgi:hypothetical protein